MVHHWSNKYWLYPLQTLQAYLVWQKAVYIFKIRDFFLTNFNSEIRIIDVGSDSCHFMIEISLLNQVIKLK